MNREKVRSECQEIRALPNGVRPAVRPSYGLFVERSADPIDNPARPHWPLPTVHTTLAQNQTEDRHEASHRFIDKTNAPQPKLVAKPTL